MLPLKPRMDLVEITLSSLIVFTLIYYFVGSITSYRLTNIDTSLAFSIISLFTTIILGFYHSDRVSQWKREHPN